jgi:hypothetical protein
VTVRADRDQVDEPPWYRQQPSYADDQEADEKCLPEATEGFRVYPVAPAGWTSRLLHEFRSSKSRRRNVARE